LKNSILVGSVLVHPGKDLLLSNSIRILFGNEAAYLLIRIPAGKIISEELHSHLFLPIGKVDKFEGRR
jgi:hypothetical protein